MNGTLFLFRIFLFIALAVDACAAASARQSEGKARADKAVLSDQEISALVTAHRDEKSGRSYALTASFQQRRLHPVSDALQLRRYKKSGEVPFIVYAELSEIKEQGGRKLAKRVNGTAYIYIQDELNNVVSRANVPLSTLCPG
jgi:hypothetical protein